ncbi:MAG: hypothetical protein E2P02_03940 [Acidobacteria bacterium]|nr:MAG: hypothetical protein E2P02_03940 [Acidobacteriota bacterium]
MRCIAAYAILFVLLSSLAVNGSQLPTTGEGLYRIGCAQCHGETGAGVPLDRVAFDVPLPDFADCSFATREPDFDWIAVSHQGGPVRGFDASMPAFGEAFDIEQLQKIVDFIRTFCAEDAWPSGELNFPRPMFTEKAYPEDELIWTVGVATEGKGELTNELLYERRFGARYQWELAVPFGAGQSTSGDPWAGGIGDVTLGIKSTVYHRLDRGNILSLNAEVAVPTGANETAKEKASLFSSRPSPLVSCCLAMLSSICKLESSYRAIVTESSKRFSGRRPSGGRSPPTPGGGVSLRWWRSLDEPKMAVRNGISSLNSNSLSTYVNMSSPTWVYSFP